jgi:hypothetical protein
LPLEPRHIIPENKKLPIFLFTGVFMDKGFCSKFRQGSLSTAAAILRGLREGLYPAQVAGQLGKGRSFVHYYVNRMENLGWIEKQTGVIIGSEKSSGLITPYRLTENGSNFLAEIEKDVLRRRVRLHNCYWLYPIIEQPKIKIDWRKVEMQNWNQLIGRELGLTVRKNPKSLEIISGVIYGVNPYELLFKSREEADELAYCLEQKFLMRLGRPKMSRRPHFGVYDPLAAKWAKHFQLDSECGMIDRSLGYGEIDWTDPVSAQNYLCMPNRLERIERSMDVFAKGMHEHMLLIRELRDLVKALRENSAYTP